MDLKDQQSPRSPTVSNQDPPPAYEEAQPYPAPALAPKTLPTANSIEQHSSNSLFSHLAARPRTNQPKIVVECWRPEKPLRFFGPDPKRVKCRCGKHVDTTTHDKQHNLGTVLCTCGYLVESTGYSYRPTTARWAHCSCGRAVDTESTVRLYHKYSSTLTRYEYTLPAGSGRCTCGKTVRSDGTVKTEHPNSCCRVLSRTPTKPC
jgi:hypothetical protein